MSDLISRLMVHAFCPKNILDPNLRQAYREYVELRIRFLLERFRRFPDFPGVQTGYSALTGEEFSAEHLFSYTWINGRGACVFARFADYFPNYHDELMRYALNAIEAMEHHMNLNQRCLPFMVNLDGTEKVVHQPVQVGYRSDSDLHGCAGFLEYGARSKDFKRVATAKQMFEDIVGATKNNTFVTQPELTPSNQIPHSFFTINVANEFVKLFDDTSYLDECRKLIENSLDNFYFPDWGAVVERIKPEGGLFVDENGHCVVDPGHTIEFIGFVLEFSRLAEKYGKNSDIQRKVNELGPQILLWNLDHGWNPRQEGIYKNIDAESHAPLKFDMPWWSLPESMVTLLLAYERTGDEEFLKRYCQINNAYFTHYMNTKTQYGPFQTRDGQTGQPIDVVPACKFQDPEFHSGRNILACVDIMERLVETAK